MGPVEDPARVAAGPARPSIGGGASPTAAGSVPLSSLVLLTRTPLRVSIGGGGTDLPSYYRQHGGSVIAAAINKYIYIAVNPTFTDDYLLKYSEQVACRRRRRDRAPAHPRGAEDPQRQPGIEIVSVADIPAGTGLGSSGAFTVGLLRALYALEARARPPQALAEEACHIEIDRLGDPVGQAGPVHRRLRRAHTTSNSAPDEARPRRAAGRSPRRRCSTSKSICSSSSPATRARRRAILDDQKQRSESGDARDARQPRLRERIGREIRSAALRGRATPRTLRRADARALGEQARTERGNLERAGRRAGTSSARRQRRASAASWSAPAPEVSCSSTPRTTPGVRDAMAEGGAARGPLRLRPRRHRWSMPRS